MKYIVIISCGFEEMIIFPNHRAHKDMASVLNAKVISAGMIKIDSKHCNCWGYSTTLDLASRGEEDDEVLKRLTKGEILI